MTEMIDKFKNLYASQLDAQDFLAEYQLLNAEQLFDPKNQQWAAVKGANELFSGHWQLHVENTLDPWIDSLLKLKISGLEISYESKNEITKLDLKKTSKDLPASTRALNCINMLFTNGILKIRVKENFSIDQPLNLNFLIANFIDDQKNLTTLFSPRIEVELGENSELQLHQIFASESGQTLINANLFVKVNKGAKFSFLTLQNVEMQDTFFGSTIIDAYENSSVNLLNLTLGAKCSRQDLICNILGENVNFNVNGLFTLSATQIADCHSWIRHFVGNSKVQQGFSGIGSGTSRGVFCGRVQILRQAQGAESAQLNRNLLLSPSAQIDSRPELDVFADNVKATHGATVGRLNLEEIFYLQSRGVPEETALLMLTESFANTPLMEFLQRESEFREQKLDSQWILDHIKKSITKAVQQNESN